MFMTKRLPFMLVSTALLVLTACSSAPHRIADEDLSKEWSGQPYKDLLLIGAYTDRPTRVSAEAAFAEMLKARGIMATPSYDLMPDLTALEDNVMIAEKLATLQQDAVLVIATLNEGYDYDVGDYFATRGLVYLLGGEPGAATDMGSFIAWAGSGQYELYVGLWDAKTAQQVWQITTYSSSSGSDTEDNKAPADFLVSTMSEKGLL